MDPSTSATYAILALDTNCQSADQLLISGSSSVFSGAVHSNSDLQVSGSDNTFNSAATYSCDVLVGGQNNTFTSGPAKAQIVSLAQNYTYSDFPCTYTFTKGASLQSHHEVWVGNNPSSKRLKDGVYCSTLRLPDPWTLTAPSGARITPAQLPPLPDMSMAEPWLAAEKARMSS